MKHHSYSLPDPHDTDNIFKVMDSKVKVTNNIFKKAVFRKRHIDWWFAI